jgi:hypothetical protein
MRKMAKELDEQKKKSSRLDRGAENCKSPKIPTAPRSARWYDIIFSDEKIILLPETHNQQNDRVYSVLLRDTHRKNWLLNGFKWKKLVLYRYSF